MVNFSIDDIKKNIEDFQNEKLRIQKERADRQKKYDEYLNSESYKQEQQINSTETIVKKILDKFIEKSKKGEDYVILGVGSEPRDRTCGLESDYEPCEISIDYKGHKITGADIYTDKIYFECVKKQLNSNDLLITLIKEVTSGKGTTYKGGGIWTTGRFESYRCKLELYYITIMPKNTVDWIKYYCRGSWIGPIVFIIFIYLLTKYII